MSNELESAECEFGLPYNLFILVFFVYSFQYAADYSGEGGYALPKFFHGGKKRRRVLFGCQAKAPGEVCIHESKSPFLQGLECGPYGFHGGPGGTYLSAV